MSGWQTNNVGSYRRTGVTAEDAMKVFRKAYEYQENGMVGMTIEMTSRELTDAVAKHLRIPVVAVAAGGAADGSEMVIFDLSGFIPPQAMSQHAKYYANVISDCIQGASIFNQEVKTGVYPAPGNGWSMDERELDKFMNLLEQQY